MAENNESVSMWLDIKQTVTGTEEVKKADKAVESLKEDFGKLGDTLDKNMSKMSKTLSSLETKLSNLSKGMKDFGDDFNDSMLTGVSTINILNSSLDELDFSEYLSLVGNLEHALKGLQNTTSGDFVFEDDFKESLNNVEIYINKLYQFRNAVKSVYGESIGSYISMDIERLGRDITKIVATDYKFKKGSRLDAEREKAIRDSEEELNYKDELEEVTRLIGAINKASSAVTSTLKGETVYLEDYEYAVKELSETLSYAKTVSSDFKSNELGKGLSESIAQGSSVLGNASLDRKVTSEGSRLDAENLKKYTEARKQAWSTIGKYADGITRLSWSAFKNGGKLSIKTLKYSFLALGKSASSIWSLFYNRGNTTISQLKQSMKQLFGFFSLYKLVDTGRDSVEFASDMVEVRNVLMGVFKDATSDIEDFAKTAITSFGLTQLQASKFAGAFGGSLEASNIVGRDAQIMSKNLTALAGDIASFYNLDIEESFDRLAAGMAGQSKALRALGVNMNVVNLEAYAMKHGIDASWKSLDVATQQMIRYNYIIETLTTAQGDFSRTSGTWANQVRLLSSNWQQLLSILGGASIKVFYPVIVTLNQILNLALQAAKAMANIFGFDYTSLEDQFGTGANLDYGGDLLEIPDSDTKGLDDYSDAAKDASKATDDLNKSTEKAGEGLLSFDKLNNITTNSLEERSDASKDVSKCGKLDGKVGLGLKPLSYIENVKNPTSEVNKWLDDWIKLMQDKRWYEAGEKLSKLLEKGVDSLYGKLTSEEHRKNLKTTAKSMSAFINGFASNTKLFYKSGKLLGAGTNNVTTFLNTLTDETDWTQMGRDINEFFKGFAEDLDGKELGKALGNPFKIAIDVLAGTLENEETWKAIGEDVTNGINGFFERVDLRTAVPTLLKFGGNIVKYIGGAILDADWDKITDDFVGGMNIAISEIDEEDLHSMFYKTLRLLTTLLNGFADLDFGGFGTKVGKGINGAVEDGTVRELSSSVVKVLGNILDMFTSAAKEIDWIPLVTEILGGIKDGFLDLEADEQVLIGILAALGLTAKTLQLSSVSGLTDGLTTLLTKALTTSLGSAFTSAFAAVGTTFVATDLIGSMGDNLEYFKTRELLEYSKRNALKLNVPIALNVDTSEIEDADDYISSVAFLQDEYLKLSPALQSTNNGLKDLSSSFEQSSVTAQEAQNQVRNLLSVYEELGFKGDESTKHLRELLAVDVSTLKGSETQTYINALANGVTGMMLNLETSSVAISEALENAGNNTEELEKLNNTLQESLTKSQDQFAKTSKVYADKTHDYLEQIKRDYSEMNRYSNYISGRTSFTGGIGSGANASRPRIMGTRISGLLGDGISSYSLFSDFVSSYPSQSSAVSSLGGISQDRISLFRQYTAGSQLLSPRQVEQFGTVRSYDSIDAKTIAKLDNIISKLNSMRSSSTGTLPQNIDIRIGNKEIEDFIVDTIRRNKYRLGN